MTSEHMPRASWWAKGVLFENCNCTTVCPGHVHFSQACTHERCKGFWVVRFREGELDGVDLAGVDAVVAYDSPQRMISGDWTEAILVTDTASERQVGAVERILSGAVGGPWQVLDRFVAQRMPTRTAAIRIEEEDRTKRIVVDGVLESSIEAIKGRDREHLVTFENIFNQVHAPSQVIARGTSRYDDGTITLATEGTHGLWSDFSWVVTGE